MPNRTRPNIGNIEPTERDLDLYNDIGPEERSGEPEAEQETSYNTTVIPREILPGEHTVGETVTFKIVGVYEDEYEIEPVTEQQTSPESSKSRESTEYTEPTETESTAMEGFSAID